EREAARGEVSTPCRVADRRSVALAIRDRVEDRRHRSGVGTVGKPQTDRHPHTIGQIDPVVVDHPHPTEGGALLVGARPHAGADTAASLLAGSRRGKWHAASWVGPNGRSGGSSSAHRAWARGQRVRKRHPEGG